MADPGDKKKNRATYQDVLDAPEDVVAEILSGERQLTPRPGGPHTMGATALTAALVPPFHYGKNGPGGWIILAEPELHLGADVVVPDLAGWRRDRMPTVTRDAYFTIAPDWVCEVVSIKTEANDRAKKLPIYASAGVGHCWLLSAVRHTLEVFRLNPDGNWQVVAIHFGDKLVRAEPFEAIELDLGMLWADIAPPPAGRASEPVGYDYEYDY